MYDSPASFWNNSNRSFYIGIINDDFSPYNGDYTVNGTSMVFEEYTGTVSGFSNKVKEFGLYKGLPFGELNTSDSSHVYDPDDDWTWPFSYMGLHF